MSRAAVVSFLFAMCLALAFSLADKPAHAREDLPPEVLMSIQNAARSGQTPNYALSAAVMSALTYHPAHVEEIIAQAVIADLGSFRQIVSDATRAFPRFANRIKAGADGAHYPPHPVPLAIQSRFGVLSCESVPGTRWNFLVTSSVDIACTFQTSKGTENYKGETGIATGVDLDFKTSERFGFTVSGLEARYRIGSHRMSGKYVSSKASASADIDAAILAGGGKGNFTLEPLVLEGNTGLGVAAGLGYLYIEPADR